MAITTLSSPLLSSANNIVSLNSKSKPSLVKAQVEYKKFGNFIESKRIELERTPLPDKSKILKLANINVVNTFGSAGGLLNGLFSGALDLGGLISGFFPGENTKVGATPKVGKSRIIPQLKSGKLRLGGVRALGITNALFAGLDFATGLTEGESVGKSAAGTAGSLAGSLLGGAIGQTLIPVPGIGFVIGSAAGSFLSGYGVDRAYDSVENQRRLQLIQEAKLREQSQTKEKTKKGKVENQNKILNKFDDIAGKFEGFVKGIVGGVVGGIFGGPRGTPYTTPNSPRENDSQSKLNEDANYSGGGRIVQFLHGEKGRAGYDPGHWNHDHFSFNSREAAVVAFKALKNAGYEPYEFEGYTKVGGHSRTGGHYGPVGGPKTPQINDGTAFDIPYSSYGSGPIGPKDYEKSRKAEQIVLQALKGMKSSKPKVQGVISNPTKKEPNISKPGGNSKIISTEKNKSNMNILSIKRSSSNNKNSLDVSKLMIPNAKSSSTIDNSNNYREVEKISFIPQSIISTPPPKVTDVSFQLPYQRQKIVIIKAPEIIAAGGGGGPSKPTIVPVSTGGGGGTTVIIASSGYQIEKGVLNKLQELPFV
jgi:hypothetical protein